jgi:hypothetical protein
MVRKKILGVCEFNPENTTLPRIFQQQLGGWGLVITYWCIGHWDYCLLLVACEKRDCWRNAQNRVDCASPLFCTQFCLTTFP